MNEANEILVYVIRNRSFRDCATVYDIKAAVCTIVHFINRNRTVTVDALDNTNVSIISNPRVAIGIPLHDCALSWGVIYRVARCTGRRSPGCRIAPETTD